MTIQNSTCRAAYIADGQTVSYPVPFYFFNQELQVYQNDEQEPVDQSLYTITKSETATGGEITFAEAPAAETKIIILRNVALTQLVTFLEGEDFPASDYEYSLDRMIMALQQLKELLGRTLAVPAGSEMSVEEAYQLLTEIGKNFAVIKNVPQLAEKVQAIYNNMLSSVTSSVSQGDTQLVTSGGVWTYVEGKRCRKYTNITVSSSAAVADTSYAGYPYRLDLQLAEATAEHVPTVMFGLEEAVSGNFAPVATASAGCVSIYMKAVPSTASVTIPAVILH